MFFWTLTRNIRSLYLAFIQIFSYFNSVFLSEIRVLVVYLFSPIVVIQLLSRVQLFVTPWAAARQASLFITNSRSLPKLMSIESVMPSNRLILCHPLLLLPSISPSIMGFSNELALRIRWPKYWNFSFSSSPSNEYLGLISFRIDWFDLLVVQGTLTSFSNTTVSIYQIVMTINANYYIKDFKDS